MKQNWIPPGERPNVLAFPINLCSWSALLPHPTSNAFPRPPPLSIPKVYRAFFKAPTPTGTASESRGGHSLREGRSLPAGGETGGASARGGPGAAAAAGGAGSRANELAGGGAGLRPTRPQPRPWDAGAHFVLDPFSRLGS